MFGTGHRPAPACDGYIDVTKHAKKKKQDDLYEYKLMHYFSLEA